jgi:sugar phosphate isomerase/epimerase
MKKEASKAMRPTSSASVPIVVAPSRREFLKRSAAMTIGAAAVAGVVAPGRIQAEDAKPAAGGAKARKFKVCLSPGLIGVRADLKESIDLATRFGFEAIEPASGELASMSEDAVKQLRESMKTKDLVWGATSIDSPFGRSDEEFKGMLGKLPDMAATLQRAGAKRVATWLTPGENRLTYLENFRRHVQRVKEIARIFGDHGLVFGLEYVGPRTSWSRSRFPFIHTLREMRELITETGCKNVGLLLDSWHWYTAGETAADVKALRNEDIVAVHLNDAPSGVTVDQQVDSRRTLPAATGVIDIGAFFGALIAAGYDGPVAAEPFDAHCENCRVNKQSNARWRRLRKHSSGAEAS